MRSSQKSNRARGRGGRKPSGGNNINRVYESAGPEGKVRGTPQQIIDKYLSLARDAQTSGDRVVAENFLQHAEHYQRILVEAMGARQERREAQAGEGDQPDLSDGADGGPDEAAAQSGGQGQPQDQNTQGQNSHEQGSRDQNAQGQNGERGQNRRRRGNGRAAEVAGLTTIDSGEGPADDLLVEAEELSASQPKRRRRPGQAQAGAEGGASEGASSSAPSGAEPQPEPQPE